MRACHCGLHTNNYLRTRLTLGPALSRLNRQPEGSGVDVLTQNHASPRLSGFSMCKHRKRTNRLFLYSKELILGSYVERTLVQGPPDASLWEQHSSEAVSQVCRGSADEGSPLVTQESAPLRSPRSLGKRALHRGRRVNTNALSDNTAISASNLDVTITFQNTLVRAGERRAAAPPAGLLLASDGQRLAQWAPDTLCHGRWPSTAQLLRQLRQLKGKKSFLGLHGYPTSRWPAFLPKW